MKFELKFPKCARISLAACLTLLTMASVASFGGAIPETEKPTVIVPTDKEPVTPGKFQPTWESLRQYRTPEWFRDAKFGIWFCYGPQCQAEMGDWYARSMYIEGSKDNKFHVEHYGPPSQFGFKDLIHIWKADKWDADKLVSLYQKAGAQYIFVMAQHHDNFDLYDSKYQPWNSVKIGPMKDIVGDVAKAAKAHGLRLGVTVHAAHAWTFYETAQGADKKGPLAGVPYDGKLTLADGKGKWWEGLDPQDLYAQNHKVVDALSVNKTWDWNNGVVPPDAAYCEKFYNRTIDLVHKYKPDVVYFDDDVLPLWPVSDAGLKIAADFYNSNMQWHNGKLEAVVLGKTLDEDQRKCLVWDIERGTSNRIEPLPWQTDTCIGQWHYSRPLYEKNGYKHADGIIRTLADIVSKNGNLMLNIPVRGEGTIDEKEEAILNDLAVWMSANKECIFGTRPWKVFGEGPSAENQLTTVGNFNEGKVKPFTADDIRFTTKDGAVYAIVLGKPDKDIAIKSLGTAAKLFDGTVGKVELLGNNQALEWTQNAEALTIKLPGGDLSTAAQCLKISPAAGR
jgi:alpha-L-fucosidase